MEPTATPPQLTVGVVTHDTVPLLWTSPSSTEPANRYNVYKNGTPIASVKTLGYTIRDQAPNEKMTFFIRAYYADNVILESKLITVSTFAEPVFPDDPEAEIPEEDLPVVPNPDGSPGHDGIRAAIMSMRPNPVALTNFALAQIQRIFTYHRIHSYKWADEGEQNGQTGMSDGDVGYRKDTRDNYEYRDGAWILRGGVLGVAHYVTTEEREGEPGKDSFLTSASGFTPRGWVSIFGSVTFKAVNLESGGYLKIHIDGAQVHERRWDTVEGNDVLTIPIYAESNIAKGTHEFKLMTTHDPAGGNVKLSDASISAFYHAN